MSLANGSLTTLANVKAYVSSPPSDTVLNALITRESRFILSYLNRSLLVPKTYTEQYNGTGTLSLVLSHWPLISLTSLLISGATISIAPQENNQDIASTPYGYRFQPWNGIPPGNPAMLELTGGAFYYWGNQNVVATYRAGYQVTGEVPTAGATYTPQTPYGIWATDEGVTYSDGTALTAITTGSPSVGEYIAPTPEAATPVLTYTFNAADVTTGLLINYGFVPADLEQVCIEMIAERSAYRSRVGIRSQSLAGQETMAFDLGSIPAYARAMLQPYMSVLPPAIGANV